MTWRSDAEFGVGADETASDAHLASFSMGCVESGPARGCRVLSVAPAGGLHSRVLVDRGMDLGAVWFRGIPIAWTSGTGEASSGRSDDGEGWHDGWAGGLVTTCGLQNVGIPNEGHGRHGRYSEQPADELVVRRVIVGQGRGAIIVEGVVREPLDLGRGLVHHRRMTFPLWHGSVEIDDVTTNETSERLQTPILYHVNLGAPFLDAAAVPLVPAGDALVAAPGVRPMGPPATSPDEVHDLSRGEPTGLGECAIDSKRLGLRLQLDWSTDTLPRLLVWQRRRPGTYVTAVEPANCSVEGREADRRNGVAPFLDPGESRHTRLRIQVNDLKGDPRDR